MTGRLTILCLLCAVVTGGCASVVAPSGADVPWTASLAPQEWSSYSSPGYALRASGGLTFDWRPAQTTMHYLWTTRVPKQLTGRTLTVARAEVYSEYGKHVASMQQTLMMLAGTPDTPE